MSIFGPSDHRCSQNASIFGPKNVKENDEVIAIGNLNMRTHLIQNVGSPVDPQDAATKNYVDTRAGDGTQPAVVRDQGNLDMDTHFIQNVRDPVNPQDAATKNYVDTRVDENTCLFVMASRGSLRADDYAWCPRLIRDATIRAVGYPMPVDFEVTHIAATGSARGGGPVAEEVQIALTKAAGNGDEELSPQIRTPVGVRIQAGKITGLVEYPSGVLYRAGDRLNLQAISLDILCTRCRDRQTCIEVSLTNPTAYAAAGMVAMRAGSMKYCN